MDNSKSLFRDMIQTALDEDLNKTDLQVFLVLLSQTLGFGKASDPLTYGRIAHHMHKRKDHVKKSARKLVTTGLFDAAKHKSFDFTYTIGAKFLVKHRGDFFTPTLPKTGENFRKMVQFSENWEHTDLYPYNSLSTHLQQPLPIHSPEEILNPDPKIACCCGGCDYKKPSSAEVVTHTEPKPNIVASNKEDLTNINALQPPQPKQTSVPDWENASLPELPKLIPAQGANTIYTIFKRGTPEQAQNALLVFADIQKKELISSPVGLLRRLAEWSQDGSLTLPNEQSNLTKQSYHSHKQQNTPYSAAHTEYKPELNANRTPEQIAKDKLAGDIAYLYRIAALSPDESLIDVAKDAGMEDVLAHIDTTTS